MSVQTNPQLELAFEFVRNTQKHLFLTGKAGSGKTTFLHQIKAEGLKRMAVVAPTGVAAINAGGMTIHSLFQLPLGLHLPGAERKESDHQRHFRSEKIRLIRSLDLLVIDEISMVRADLLDAVDQVLRKFRHPQRPFGGVQLLMIGDLHQLPPVVKPDDWELLKQSYETPYFFGSLALQQTEYATIELKHIYRQADPDFIGLLNQVRDNRLDEAGLRKLNSRFIADFRHPADQPYITLTATNAAANQINLQNLNRLSGKRQASKAVVAGQFPPGSYPTDELLEFKVGAQVMFIRNDTSPARRYFNGKIGCITRMDTDGVWVTCPDDAQAILVQPAEWTNVKYALNEQTKQIEEQVLGSFTQYPLRLAWAITIHKSQGLTFERCIIDAQAAFATGQVYVALSRCKSFEGIVLRSRIDPTSVKTDPVVQRFSLEAEKRYPTLSEVQQAKRQYQADTIRELFSFEAIAQALRKLLYLAREHASSILPETFEQCRLLEGRAHQQLFRVSENFAPQLAQYLDEDCLPAEHETLQMRTRKASQYFQEKLSGLAEEAKQLSVATDNKEVALQFDKALDALRLALAVKLACFVACQNGFSTEAVNRATVNAELDFSNRGRQPGTRAPRVPKGIPHPELYRQLWQWREEVAQRDGVPVFSVVPNRTLKELVVFLPTDQAALGEVPGIGKARLRRYGHDLTAILRKYCQEHQIEASAIPRLPGSSAAAAGASPTQQISLEMFRSGKSISEIARQRGLVAGTIAGHLAHFVRAGELDIFSLMERQQVEAIEKYLTAGPVTTLSAAKAHFGTQYDYVELKLVMAHIARERSSSQSEHQ